ncbi:PAN domain-containing protein [Paludibaculum fermentans]|uniref:PAN domain-containing protein n=1 Tax=Paludibaculum fermentans TaxID=1473598 RepID=UPI003EC0E54E
MKLRKSNLVMLACLALVAAAGTLAAQQAQRVSLDEAWHKLNSIVAEEMVVVREMDRARLLIVRGLTNNYTQPAEQLGRRLTKREMEWLAGGLDFYAGASYTPFAQSSAAARTTAATKTGGATQPRSAVDQQLIDAYVKYKNSGLTEEEFIHSEYGSSENSGDESPSGSQGLFNRMRNYLEEKFVPMRDAATGAQSAMLDAYVSYFDHHWNEIDKCCIEKRLGEARPGLTYVEFKNRLRFPNSYRNDPLQAEERAALVSTLTSCLPSNFLLEVNQSDLLRKQFIKMSKAGWKAVADKSFETLGSLADLGTGASKALSVAVDWATGGAVNQDDLEEFVELDRPGGPMEPQAVTIRRPGGDDAVVAVFYPRNAEYPSQWIALKLVNGRIEVPGVYTGLYDLYLYRPGLRPALIRGVRAEAGRRTLVRAEPARTLKAGSKPPSRVKVNPDPDKPPEPPRIPPVQGCPCKPYRIHILSETTCSPLGEVPNRYSSVRFEGVAEFDVFESDYDFSGGRRVRSLKPVLVPMVSRRQLYQGTLAGAAYTHMPASLEMTGEMSITLELSRQGQSICLEVRDEPTGNPSVPVRDSIRDLATGHVIQAVNQEYMFAPGLAYPFEMVGRNGCGFPGRVSMEADSSFMPRELRNGCSWRGRIVVEPKDGAPPLSHLDPVTPPDRSGTSSGTPRDQAPRATSPLPSLETETARPASRFEVNVNRNGEDYRDFLPPRPDPALCAAACAKEGRCRSWTWVKSEAEGPNGHCWLKHSMPQPDADDCCVSGLKQ